MGGNMLLEVFAVIISQWLQPMQSPTTDHKVRLPYVIIDIAKPPTGGLDLFNLYVALSCSSGRESIWLLWDFNNELFKKSHDSVLLAEDDRLDKMDRITKGSVGCKTGIYLCSDMK